MSLPKQITKRQPLFMSGTLKEDFEDVIGYQFNSLEIRDDELSSSIEGKFKQEPETFQSSSPIWEVDLIDFNTPDWRDFLATDPICQ